MIKVYVFRRWEFRLLDAQSHIAELEDDLEYQRYEYDVTKRLYDAASDEKECEGWQGQMSGLHDLMVETQTNLVEQQEEAARCQAMVEAIRADLTAEGIDPDDYDDIADYLFDDGSDGPEFGIPFDDDIPFNDDTDIPF